MEENDEISENSPSKAKRVNFQEIEEGDKLRTCSVCKDNQGLYCCPRCSIFTCSLECCLKHKLEV